MLAGLEGLIRPEIASSTSSGKLESRLKPTSEENQRHFSRATEVHEGVFCSDDRILLGLIAASLVLPLEGETGKNRGLRG
jgi:hypothetical protein